MNIEARTLILFHFARLKFPESNLKDVFCRLKELGVFDPERWIFASFRGTVKFEWKIVFHDGLIKNQVARVWELQFVESFGRHPEAPNFNSKVSGG